MSIFKKLFSGSQTNIECPRCLGKGHVDAGDIKRLNQELKWLPGTCAYCNGSGAVHSKILENVPVDASYLVLDLPDHQRKKIIQGSPDALEQGRQQDAQVDAFISQINYLHLEAGLAAPQIVEFFMIGKEDSPFYEHEKQELSSYVERVIQLRQHKN